MCEELRISTGKLIKLVNVYSSSSGEAIPGLL